MRDYTKESLQEQIDELSNQLLHPPHPIAAINQANREIKELRERLMGALVYLREDNRELASARR